MTDNYQAYTAVVNEVMKANYPHDWDGDNTVTIHGVSIGTDMAYSLEGNIRRRLKKIGYKPSFSYPEQWKMKVSWRKE